MFKEYMEIVNASNRWLAKYWKQYLGIWAIIYGCVFGWLYRDKIKQKLKKFKKTKKVES